MKNKTAVLCDATTCILVDGCYILEIFPLQCVCVLKDKSYPITDPDGPLGLQEVEVPRISRHSAHEGGKVDSPTHRPSLPHEGFLILISVSG